MRKRIFFIGICWIGVYLGACGKQTAEAGNGGVRQPAVEIGSTLTNQDKDGQEYERSGALNEAEAANLSHGMTRNWKSGNRHICVIWIRLKAPGSMHTA